MCSKVTSKSSSRAERVIVQLINNHGNKKRSNFSTKYLRKILFLSFIQFAHGINPHK